ncbi:organic solute transporter subunit alpha-like [Saccoglossus kowalevskii]|uniref:Organic solute transporter subunit alpha-like isoform X1 n=1 Tax=Saccoglossus kowalevskii TaxID=10224 RepID=A0ABM0M228_SACKO|nr:PREDICTED: organic solute transporter subunit alpha-like isoform X1 [Saccoglossus kowalevskii]XP_006814069.1 PREDICTED: organic solute transporter subunit alpha-like isoform X2 [Saccoglossus kowalevskii]
MTIDSYYDTNYGTLNETLNGNYTFTLNDSIPEIGEPMCPKGLPPAAIYMKVLTGKHIAMLSLAAVFTLINLIVFIDAFIFLNAQVPLKRRKARILWILGIYPVFSVSSLIALCIPRSSVLTGLTSSMYLSVALYQFMLLVFDYFGGLTAMVAMLKGQKMFLGTPPVLILCCCCMPSLNITRPSLRWLRRLVLQVAVVRPIILFICAVMWADGSALYIPGKFTPDGAFLYLQTVSVLSTLTAFQAIVILFKVSKEPLMNYKIVPKFFSIQLAMIFSNIQGVLIGFLIAGGKIPCTPTWSSGMEGMFIHNFALIIEMFTFSLLARFSYRKRAGNLDYVAPPRPSFMRPRSSISFKWQERNGDTENYLKAKGEFKEIEDMCNGNTIVATVPKQNGYADIIKTDLDQPISNV